MMFKEEKVDNLSGELKAIFNSSPKFVSTWGLILIVGVLVILISCSWLIKYPDVIKSDVTITTNHSPVRLSPKVSGDIQRIYVSEGEKVKKGTPILEIKSSLNSVNAKLLDSLLNSLILDIQSESLPPSNFVDRINTIDGGSLQSLLGNLSTKLLNYKLLMKPQNQYYIRIKSTYSLIDDEISKLELLNRQYTLMINNLSNSKMRYDKEKKLHQNGYISDIEFEKITYELNNEKLEFNEFEITKHNLTSNINKLRRKVSELQVEYTDEISSLKNEIITISNEIKSGVENWRDNFVITAPFDGIVTQIKDIEIGQFYKAETPIYAIVPNDNGYSGKIQISSLDIAKVSIDQEVRIKLFDYPHHKYGYFVGRIKRISLVPDQSWYLVEVEIEQPSSSSAGVKLEYRPEMEGIAEILTEELRIYQRIFEPLKGVFK